MTDRVRALLITPDGELLTIRRIRSGREPYWVLPGGHVESGEDLEAALARELREEIAATADVHGLLAVLELAGERQYFYLGRARTWSADAGDRSGPEFADPGSGDYHLEAIPLTASALNAVNLQPAAIAQLIGDQIAAGEDLFALPDLRVPEAD